MLVMQAQPDIQPVDLLHSIYIPGGNGVAVRASTETEVATARGLASQALWPRTTLKNSPTNPDMTVPPAVYA